MTKIAFDNLKLKHSHPNPKLTLQNAEMTSQANEKPRRHKIKLVRSNQQRLRWRIPTRYDKMRHIAVALGTQNHNTN